MVFAAASLTDSMKEMATAYEKETGDTLKFNFAGSNTLAQQIQSGAPADVFFSADEAKMDALAKAGLIVDSTRANLLGNSLVIITAATDGYKLTKAADLAAPGLRRLSLADTRAVPAGVYAKAYLEKAGLWKAVESRVAPAENVRAALAVVESGNAEAGIVYKTDAAISKKVKVALEIPESEVPAIRYPAAVVKDARNPEGAGRFLKWLSGDKARAIFVKFGFSPLT